MLQLADFRLQHQFNTRKDRSIQYYSWPTSNCGISLIDPNRNPTNLYPTKSPLFIRYNDKSLMDARCKAHCMSVPNNKYLEVHWLPVLKFTLCPSLNTSFSNFTECPMSMTRFQSRVRAGWSQAVTLNRVDQRVLLEVWPVGDSEVYWGLELMPPLWSLLQNVCECTLRLS